MAIMDVQVDAFLKRLDSPKEYSNHTRKAYANDLRSFVDFQRAALKRHPSVLDFTFEQVSAYLLWEQKAGRSPSTLFRRRASLRQFSRYLLEQGLLESDPTAGAEAFWGQMTREIGAKKEVGFLQDEEIQAVEALMEKGKNPRAWRDLAIFRLLIETGLLIGDLLILDVGDIDLEGRELRLPTTDGEEVAHPINSSAEQLKVYLRRGRPELSPAPDEKALFISQMGGRMTRQTAWQSLRNWGIQAQLAKDLSPRIVRNTAARRMIAAGKPLEEMQMLLGHRNRNSTQALVRRLSTAQ